MDKILLRADLSSAATAVSNDFIDRFMLQANGDFVKVYIYLTRCIQAGESGLSICGLAEKMNDTENDIIHAINYWENQGLLHTSRNENGEFTAIEFVKPIAPNAVSASESGISHELTVRNTDQPHTVSEGSSVNDKDLTGAAFPADLSDNEDFIWVCSMIEAMFKRPLKSSEYDALDFIFGDLGFSNDLVLYLYNYCFSINKTSPSYIKAVAVNWNSKGINTVEAAKNTLEKYNDVYNVIRREFGITGSLLPLQKETAEAWVKEYHMSADMIGLALRRTVSQLGHSDFRYASAILKGWYSKGIRTPEEAETDSENFARSKEDAKVNKNKPVYRKSDNVYKIKPNSFNIYPQRHISDEELDAFEKAIINNN
ncbi:MAG: DnaD domain protein [Lachnospiraceae bacterium]|jgi:DnaD/phage-associated family protein|nr:DnaD domain protein [Lachnospiraceae bacterium]MEE3461160.1 DnaD domain protein [Lachnospiraceae bacterium]